MSIIPHVSEAEASEPIAKTYSRMKEMLGSDELPDPFLTFGSVEPLLRDFYMNFKKFVFTEGKLDVNTKTIIALAVALKEGSQPWIQFLTQRADQLNLNSNLIAEIAALVATNSMYNTFFKFRELSGSDLFEGFPVGLRAHTFSGTSLDETTVELINIAISDLNACKPCTKGHVTKARQLGLGDEAILEAIQCTATMAAGVQFLKSANC